jgi:hypothetical protein
VSREEMKRRWKFTQGVRQLMKQESVDNWFSEESHGKREDTMEFFVGCADRKDRGTLMLIILAARKLCGMNHPLAIDLLRKAVESYERVHPDPQDHSF